ncbi:MAG: autotransporter domain-containing protein [Alphaproteobacteria bacterium]|nr:autotransporter domain-containing protein [Alphaproteobacteria bacterium]
MQQSKTTIKELTKRYRAVLLKCALINMAAFAIAFSASAAPLAVGTGQSATPEPGTYDYIEVNDGTLSLNGGEFSTLRNDPSSLTDGTMSLSGAFLDMNSPSFAISNSTLTVNAGSQIASRAVAINNSSELTLNSSGSEIAFEADSFIINGSTVSMSGGGYGLVASSDNGISVTDSTVTANSANIAYSVAEGGNAISNPELKISGTSVFNVVGNVNIEAVTVENKTPSFTKGKIIFSGGEINLNGTLTANIEATGGTVSLNSSASRLNGALSGTVNLKFNDNYAFGNINASNATLGTVTIANGKTLDIGEGSLEATSITGGILQATLTNAAKTSAIVTASATNVILALDMSNASRDEVSLYHITDGMGFTFGDYSTNRYAVSAGAFDIADAKTIGALDGWTGGDLYILRLATAGEAAVEDLKNSGVSVSANEEKAVAALNDEVIDMLAPAQKAAAQRINALLDSVAGNATQMKQLLREVAPEAAPSASSMASANAGAVMNVVGGRMGGGAPAPAARGGASNTNRRGRSGGDYTAGALSAWAQMMYNNADLHKADGFDADSTGFAAGLEYNINDSVKAGFGYAFTDTDIDTARSTTDVDTHTAFVYGEYKPENLYVNGTLSYGHSKYDETTRLAGLQSEYRANTFAGQLMTGYTFGYFTPEAGLRYTGVRQRSYTNAFGARMASQTLDTWTWVAGVKAAKSFRAGDMTLTPDAKLALTYDFRRDGQARTVTLANGSSYVADGESMKRFGVEFGAGLSVKVGGNTDIGLSYEGKFKDHYTDHTGLINVKYNF